MNFDFEHVELKGVGIAVATVLVGVLGGFVISLYLSNKIFSANSGPFKNLALKAVQNVKEGFVSVDVSMLMLKGKTGIAKTVLRPGGKVLIDGEVIDAIAQNGFIDKDENIVVTKVEATQVYVELIE